jgi:hypothetical protein
VPILRIPPEPFAGHFLLLSSVEDTTRLQHEDFQQQRDWLSGMQQQQENGRMLQRMHTARARDSARAQSGGVKGMLTDEDGELLTSAFLFLFPVFHLHSVRACYIHILILVVPARRFFLLFLCVGTIL